MPRKTKKETRTFQPEEPLLGRKKIRDIVRWRNYKETGTFSGRDKPVSGYMMDMLHLGRMTSIDVVYQANEAQFLKWIEYKYRRTADHSWAKSPRQRLALLKALDKEALSSS